MSLMTDMSISRLFLFFNVIDPKRHHENSKNSQVIYPKGSRWRRNSFVEKGLR